LDKFGHGIFRYGTSPSSTEGGLSISSPSKKTGSTMKKTVHSPTIQELSLKEKMAELTNKWHNVDVSAGSIDEIKRKIDRMRYRTLKTSLEKMQRLSGESTPRKSPVKGKEDIVAVAQEIFNV